MPRLIVVSRGGQGKAAITFDEEVRSVHLDTEHSAAQLIERVCWAILDAESAEVQGEAELFRTRRLASAMPEIEPDEPPTAELRAA
jgi:hypothetical protein